MILGYIFFTEHVYFSSLFGRTLIIYRASHTLTDPHPFPPPSLSLSCLAGWLKVAFSAIKRVSTHQLAIQLNPDVMNSSE